MKASDLFVKALEAEGVKMIFGVPGEENLDFVESLRESSIKLIVTRHEQAAGFMAATWGRLTGRAGVALSTLGPGATNLVTAAAYAQLGAMPMLMITGQKPIRLHKQGLFQLVDVVDMMQPLTKYTRQIVSAQTIPARIREAFRRAEEERPGAVHLELPEDIARDDVDDPLLLPVEYARRPSADDAALVKAAEAISQAQHPILMIGAGANPQRTAKALRAFIDKLRIPSSPRRWARAWSTRTIHCGWATPRCPTAISCIAPSTRPIPSSTLAMTWSRSRRSSCAAASAR